MHWVKLPKADTFINLALLIRVYPEKDYQGKPVLVLEMGMGGGQWLLWVTDPEDQAVILANLPGGTP